MRKFGAVISTAILLMSNGFAAAATPLPQGKPAGVEKAALLAGPGFLLAFGIGIAALSVAVIAGNDNNNKISSSTTTTTSTLP
jgi:hypothetical protein